MEITRKVKNNPKRFLGLRLSKTPRKEKHQGKEGQGKSHFLNHVYFFGLQLPKGPSRTKNSTESKFTTAKKKKNATAAAKRYG